LIAFCNSGVGAVILTNWHYEFLIDEILPAIAREYSWPGYLPEEPHPIQIDQSDYDSYVGEYELRPSCRFVLAREAGRFYLKAAGQVPIELYAKSDVELFANVVNAEIVFEKTDRSEVTRLVLRQDGKQMSMKRVG
jgi:hypothetical protein